jgi:hypothetical protein
VNFTTTDIIAYLGAASWLPQIISWIARVCIKPVVTIIPEKNAEIGYTVYGPIFNLRLAINVDRKDSLVHHLGVTIQHEDGSKHEFEWSGMIETFSQVKSSRGESQVIERNIIPISIKLSPSFLMERFFRFNEIQFAINNKIALDNLDEQQVYMKKHNKAYQDEFMKSKHLDDYLRFIREHFFWKAGVYHISFNIRSQPKSKLTENAFKFELTQKNIDSLRENLTQVEVAIENYIKTGDYPNYTQKDVKWVWVNPIIR